MNEMKEKRNKIMNERNEKKIKGKRSRQKAGIWWGLVTLTGMFSDMGRGGLKKSRDHSSA